MVHPYPAPWNQPAATNSVRINNPLKTMILDMTNSRVPNGGHTVFSYHIWNQPTNRLNPVHP